MKLLVFIAVLFSSDLMAHNDEFLGDGAVHVLFHLSFWILLVLGVSHGARLYRAKNKSSN